MRLRKIFDKIEWNKNGTQIIRLIVAIQVIIALLDEQYATAFLGIGFLFLILIPYILDKWNGIVIPPLFEFWGIFFLFAALFLGDIQQFYAIYPWWDTALHASSGMLLGIFGLIILNGLNDNADTNLKLAPFYICIFAFLTALALGTLWEVIEFIMDLIWNLGMQAGNFDTMVDLIADTLGAAIVCAVGYVYLIRSENRELEIKTSQYKN